MIALDTSVAIAVFASWHEAHSVAVEAIGPSPRLPAHAAIETFSVLTRLPAPPPSLDEDCLGVSRGAFSGAVPDASGGGTPTADP